MKKPRPVLLTKSFKQPLGFDGSSRKGTFNYVRIRKIIFTTNYSFCSKMILTDIAFWFFSACRKFYIDDSFDLIIH